MDILKAEIERKRKMLESKQIMVKMAPTFFFSDLLSFSI